MFTIKWYMTVVFVFCLFVFVLFCAKGCDFQGVKCVQFDLFGPYNLKVMCHVNSEQSLVSYNNFMV